MNVFVSVFLSLWLFHFFRGQFVSRSGIRRNRFQWRIALYYSTTRKFFFCLLLYVSAVSFRCSLSSFRLLSFLFFFNNSCYSNKLTKIHNPLSHAQQYDKCNEACVRQVEFKREECMKRSTNEQNESSFCIYFLLLRLVIPPEPKGLRVGRE